MTLAPNSLPLLLQSTPTANWPGGKIYLEPLIAKIAPGRAFTGREPQALTIFDQMSTFLAGSQPAYPWQRWVAYEAMRRGADGRWAARNVAICAPRQNGKGNSIEERTILGICFAGEKRVLHTAHTLEIAEEAFDRMENRIENNAFLKRLYLKSERGNGRKVIFFKDIKTGSDRGPIIKYRTRSRRGGRGSGYDLIIIDEAMYFDNEYNNALRPTLTAQKSSQIIYTFTGLFPESDYMHDIRKKVLEAEGHHQGWTWLEWGADGIDNWEDAPEYWSVRSNPSTADGMITLETLMDDYNDMTVEGYAQEHLNIHQYPEAAKALIDEETLLELKDEDSKPGKKIYLGIHLAKNLSHCWITAASIREDGKVHIELIASQKGKSWVIPRLKAIRAKNNITTPLIISEINAVGMMVFDFKKNNIPYINLNARDWVKACNTFIDQYQARNLAHIGQPELEASLIGARLEDKGQGRLWSWAHSQEELGPTVAVTHAVMGAVIADSQQQRVILIPEDAGPRAYDYDQDAEGYQEWQM